MHDKAIAQILQLFGHACRDPRAEISLVQHAARIEGSQSVFRRIAKAKSVDDVLDYAAEIRYALVFDDLRFKVNFLPPGVEGKPDLLVSRDDESVYIEIKRIRADMRSLPVVKPHTGPAILRPLQLYGGEEDIRKIEQELREKFRQVRAVTGRNCIIAIWSDRDCVEEVEFEQAVKNIHQSPTDPNDGRPIPDDLLFCIFGWFWTACGTGQQLYPEALRELTEPFLKWITELRQVRI